VSKKITRIILVVYKDVADLTRVIGEKLISEPYPGDWEGAAGRPKSCVKGTTKYIFAPAQQISEHPTAVEVWLSVEARSKCTEYYCKRIGPTVVV
jgi:hypothetical protein